MNSTTEPRLLAGLGAAVLAAALMPVQAQTPAADSQRLHIRALAATCMQCHGTDGKAAPGEANVRLAGLPKDHILGQLQAFRSGQRPATVMHQLSKGYSPEQLDAIATYFSQQK